MIMKPFAPAEIRFSTAATWLSLSPSFLPANDCSSAPSSSASALGALLHLHEERVGLGLRDQADGDVVAAAAARPLDAASPPLSSSPHAASASGANADAADRCQRAAPGIAKCRHRSLSSLLRPASRPLRDNVFRAMF